jgi:hypothetical protein
MSRVEQWVTDPKANVYCSLTLDSGEIIIVNHEKDGVKGGWLRIEYPQLFRFSSDRIFACDLDTDDGKAVLRFLTRATGANTLDATPLGALVRYLQSCHSVDEVKARCACLMAIL